MVKNRPKNSFGMIWENPENMLADKITDILDILKFNNILFKRGKKIRNLILLYLVSLNNALNFNSVLLILWRLFWWSSNMVEIVDAWKVTAVESRMMLFSDKQETTLYTKVMHHYSLSQDNVFKASFVLERWTENWTKLTSSKLLDYLSKVTFQIPFEFFRTLWHL